MHDDSVSVRPATLADMSIITRFAGELEFSLRGYNTVADDERRELILDAAFGPNPSTQVFMIEVAGEPEPVGLSFVNRIFPGDGFRHGLRVNNLYISPKARSQFLPLHFGGWLIRYAAANNYARIVWNTPAAHKGSVLAYRAVGFDGEDQQMFRLTWDRYDTTLAAIERMIARGAAAAADVEVGQHQSAGEM